MYKLNPINRITAGIRSNVKIRDDKKNIWEDIKRRETYFIWWGAMAVLYRSYIIYSYCKAVTHLRSDLCISHFGRFEYLWTRLRG